MEVFFRNMDNLDSYEFSKDKKNMYIRQEATKELF